MKYIFGFNKDIPVKWDISVLVLVWELFELTWGPAVDLGLIQVLSRTDCTGVPNEFAWVSRHMRSSSWGLMASFTPAQDRVAETKQSRKKDVQGNERLWAQGNKRIVNEWAKTCIHLGTFALLTVSITEKNLLSHYGALIAGYTGKKHLNKLF